MDTRHERRMREERCEALRERQEEQRRGRRDSNHVPTREEIDDMGNAIFLGAITAVASFVFFRWRRSE